MNTDCQCVIFSDEAYNAIMTETFKKDPLETGGILLGHILDNGIWIVMEVLPPGWRSTFQYAYFEYDEQFVNYVAQNESKKYEQELSLLGLWHRHPGSMDTFSGTDDVTNRTFASLHTKGALSGLINIDPRFRLTMYHCSNPLRYTKIGVEVGDDLIPEEYFRWKYYGEEKGLNPFPPEKKNSSTSSETQYEIGSGSRNYPNTPPQNSNIITELMKVLNSKYLFLLLFIVGTAFSLFSYYSYNKLKATDDIKSLYRVYYTEYTATPSSDTIKFVQNKADTDFDRKKTKVKLSKDSSYIANLETEIGKSLKKNDITETFREKTETERSANYNTERTTHLDKVQSIKDSVASAYDSTLINAELVKLKKEFVEKKVTKFLSDFQKSHELTPDVAKKGIKSIIILLIIASLLSLLLSLLPRKHKSFVEWLVIGCSVVIAALISRLLYPYSLAFVATLFFVFVLLCFLVFAAMFILKSFNFKNKIKAKSNSNKFWYQRDPNLYRSEKANICKHFSDAEKNVENGVVSFFFNTSQKITAEQNNLSFQLVYSSDYLTDKEIKIYLVSPDLDELLGDRIKGFPYIAIDGAGESYLDLSKTLPKDKVSGMEIIRKFYEWLQLYKDWSSDRIDLKNMKL